MAGRKGYGEEIKIINRYSELSEKFFDFLKDKFENGSDEDKWKAVTALKGAFEKMIPQKLDGEFTNTNLNADVECSPEEHEAVKQALLAAIPNPGSPE